MLYWQSNQSKKSNNLEQLHSLVATKTEKVEKIRRTITKFDMISETLHSFIYIIQYIQWFWSEAFLPCL